MILLDLLVSVMNTHKMNDLALRLGLLRLQSVFIDSFI